MALTVPAALAALSTLSLLAAGAPPPAAPQCASPNCKCSLNGVLLAGSNSLHMRDCHFADALSPCLLKHLLNLEGVQ